MEFIANLPFCHIYLSLSHIHSIHYPKLLSTRRYYAWFHHSEHHLGNTSETGRSTITEPNGTGVEFFHSQKPITGEMVTLIKPTDGQWPQNLSQRLGAAAPSSLHVMGPVTLLATHRTALFCSARTPGDAILRAHDAARRMRDEGVTVVSGFHSPIEKECLNILLRGKQPIIICPARAIKAMRIPTECRSAFDVGRALFLSPFTKEPKRVTRDSALRRNELVAALGDEAYIPYFSSGGQTAQIAEMLMVWKVPLVADS